VSRREEEKKGNGSEAAGKKRKGTRRNSHEKVRWKQAKTCRPSAAKRGAMWQYRLQKMFIKTCADRNTKGERKERLCLW